MTKKKDPKDLKPVGCIPEVLKRFGYIASKKETLREALSLIENAIEVALYDIAPEADGQKLVLKPDLTVTGIIIALKYSSKSTFYDDCRLKNYPELSELLKRGRLIAEDSYEKRLKSNSPTGSIFALKNMGWSDRQVIEDELNDGEKKRLFD